MGELPSQARVVIIGGGAVGASALYHLALNGWTDCVLLEKNELTSGSTWHAAGNVPTFSSSWSIMNMQRYSAELYRDLGVKVDYPMNYHVTGSLRLAHSMERMQEFERVKGMGRYQGMDLNILGVDEIKSRYPFLETHDLKGALYDPYDGDIDPAQLTQALAKGARDLGAKIIRFCPVTAAKRVKGEGSNRENWLLTTPKGEIRAEYIVNAAGYYAKEVGKLFGRSVPMMVMSHQYILFDEIPELKAWSQSEGKKLPLLRDVDSSYYLRQEKFGMNLGPYEGNCRAHWLGGDDPMPQDFSFQLFPDDLERIEWHYEDAAKRVPLLQTAGLSKIINGPIPYTPDGNPLIGPMPGVPDAFEACVFTFGICQAGGAGKVLAEWVINQETEWDMWSCDPRRFTDFIKDDYCVAKGMETYGHEYAIHFPYHAWPAGRPQKTSPIYDKILSLGGQMAAYNGWERAQYFAKSGEESTEETTQTWTRLGPWQSAIERECKAVQNHVGVLEICGFSRFFLKGKGAAHWLSQQIAGNLPKINRIGLGYFPDKRGRIMTEMSIFRNGEDDFTLITAATAEWHDYEWLKKSLPENGALSLTNNTNNYSTLIVTGPKSRALFEKISDADLTLPWLSLQDAKIGDISVLLARVSFAGELGWEIHAKINHVKQIYELLLVQGATPFGMYALNCLRIEKGYRTWKGDLSSDYSLVHAGLGRFINIDKPEDFVGKQAIIQDMADSKAKIFAILEVNCDQFDVPYMSNIYHQGKIVGETTSGAYGYRIGKALALAMIAPEFAPDGNSLQVEIFGKLYDAKSLGQNGPYDPKNEKLRG